MGKLPIERVRELKREIAEIAAEKNAYLACHNADLAKKLLHERRWSGCKRSTQELTALRRRSAA